MSVYVIQLLKDHADKLKTVVEQLSSPYADQQMRDLVYTRREETLKAIAELNKASEA